MPNILHIFGRMNRAGAELRTLDIMKAVDRTQFKCHFLTLSGLPGDLDSTITDLGGTVVPCRLNAAFLPRFLNIIQRLNIDVVHSHVQYFSGLILLCARAAGVKIRIAHFRNTQSRVKTGVFKHVQDNILRKLINVNATLILGNGKGSIDNAWGGEWPVDDRCAVIHNGLDTSEFPTHDLRNDVAKEFGFLISDRVIIHVGRMNRVKNHNRLIDITAKLLKNDPRLKLMLVGRTDQSVVHEIRQRCAKESIERQVVVAGVRTDIPRLMSAADLMIFPSLHEGLPGAVLEACACDLPVLASDLPGVREISARFPSIKHLSLNDSDEVWQSVATSILSQKRKSNLAHSLAMFRNTEYDIRVCARSHEMAWLGASGIDIRNATSKLSTHDLQLAG